MQPHELICKAIANRQLLQFWYQGHTRVVEPHMLAQNEQDHYALSAWFLRSSVGLNPGWREYLLIDMRDIALLDETFSGPRPGYKPSGGEVFRRIVRRLEP
jgi:hypothetical protein